MRKEKNKKAKQKRLLPKRIMKLKENPHKDKKVARLKDKLKKTMKKQRDDGDFKKEKAESLYEGEDEKKRKKTKIQTKKKAFKDIVRYKEAADAKAKEKLKTQALHPFPAIGKSANRRTGTRSGKR